MFSNRFISGIAGSVAALSACTFPGCSENNAPAAHPETISRNSAVPGRSADFEKVMANPEKYIGAFVQMPEIYAGPGKANGRFRLQETEERVNLDTNRLEYFSLYISKPFSPFQQSVMVVSDEPHPERRGNVAGVWSSDNAGGFYLDARSKN